MKINVETNNGYRRVSIFGDITIYTAHDMKRQLLDHLHAAEKLEVNVTQVGEIDTAGFQVLYLTKREALKIGKSMHLTPSPALLKIMDTYNLAAYFGDLVTIPRARKKVRAVRSKQKAKKAI